MFLVKFKREQTLSTHNFDACQLYVCYLSDAKGNEHKGISVLCSGGVYIREKTMPLTKDKALALANYLESVVAGNLPSKFFINPYGRWLFNIFYSVTLRYYPDKKYPQFIKQRTSLFLTFVPGRLRPGSLAECAVSLRKLYD
jgi:hypothetical protein